MSLDLSTIDSFPTLSTERLLLREYEKNDAEDLLEIRTDPQVMRFMDREPFGSLKEAEKFVDLKIQDRLDHKGISWAVCDGATGQFMGDLSFWKILPRDHRAEIGYTLKSKYWRQGYMSEALRCVLAWGFDSLQLHSVMADINPHNEASRQLLLRMGFVKEGYHRENYHYRGEFLDSEMYGLLEREFRRK
jgi:ribosomal-protein-alanine N-acetyltransferase